MPIIAGRASAAYGAGFATSIPAEPFELVGSFDFLSSVTVPSGGVTSVTLAGIPTDYKHLQLRYLVRGNRADETDDFQMRFNGDSGANYSWHMFGGVSTNGSPFVYSVANGTSIPHYEGIPSANSSANVFCATVCDILDYASTKNKTVRFIQGFNTNGDVKSLVGFNSGNWRNSGAINSITLSPIYGAGIVEHSHFALYGVR